MTLEKKIEKISVLLPTRGRIKTTHGNFPEQLILSAEETCDDFNSIEFVFYVDEDDSDTREYFENLDYDNVKFICGERIVLSEMWNVCYRNASGDILFHCGDDIRFRTKGWDKVVRDKFDEVEDKILFAFGDDGKRHPGSFGTHGFIHKRWADTVGYFVPPYFSCDYGDKWLNDVAKAISCRNVNRWVYLDIYTEHIHPRAHIDRNPALEKKYIYDKTHLERLERNKEANNKELYSKYSQERKRDIKKLKGVIKQSQYR
mgnify:FL=1|tara:strand:- start:11087 stop:11863 length:777 start_codon:yes stop_codon:yes gene_type:complete